MTIKFAEYDQLLDELFAIWEECFQDDDQEYNYDWEVITDPDDLDEFFAEEDLEDPETIKVYHLAHELLEEHPDLALFVHFEAQNEDDFQYGVRLLETIDDFLYAKKWIQRFFRLLN